MPEIVRIRANCHLIKSIVSEIISVRKLIENRDIGDFVGTPMGDVARANPQLIKLTVTFFSKKSPPFKASEGVRFVKAVYNIPDIDKTQLSWATVKAACGGENGYMWGRFRATAKLDDGRQMQVYGATDVEAETRLKALLALSTTKLLTVTVAEEKQEGRRAAKQEMAKPSTQIYPAFMSILNYKKIVTESGKEIKGTDNKLAGTFKRKSTKKIPLWLPKEPSNAKSLIKDALTIL